MSLLTNVVTFGASARVKSKIEEYDDQVEIYDASYKKMERLNHNLDEQINDLVLLKVEAINSLKKINKISKNLNGKERDALIRKVGNEFQYVNLELIENTLTTGQAALNATKGVASGAATALGAWALVSTIGTASTGTAIGTLSGAAATNATLAVFGGGSLAAGGAGMAGGVMVLGGIVAIPAIALTGVFSHVNANKKICDIEKHLITVVKGIDEIEENLLQIKLMSNRAEEIQIGLKKTEEVFNTEFKKVYKEIYKYPGITKSWKWIRKTIFRRDYFTKLDYQRIAYIGGIAQEFAVVIDTKLVDEVGEMPPA